MPNTGATAVEASRYAVITQDRLETSWNWRPMVGSAVATMVWSSAARNIVSNRLIRMVRTSLCVSDDLRRNRRRGAEFDDLAGRLRGFVDGLVRQCLLVSRLIAALPFKLGHAAVCNRGRGGRRRWNREIDRNVTGKFKPRQRVRRMGASRGSAIAFP